MNLRAFSPLVALSLFLTACSTTPKQTALDRYIQKPDPSYAYKLVNTIRGEGHTLYVLEMTSQKWRSAEEVDRTEWKHWLTIIKPDMVKHGKALLFIGGGSNQDPAPSKVDAHILKTALATQSVVAELKMVPNQPLVFNGEGQLRGEDSLIAYTWDKFLRGGDETWPARLPMTKSAVRALDTITAFCGSEAGGKVAVNQFVVAGGSKRGWTTWTTAAVDKRVIGIVPFVIDLLNIEPSFKHHYRAYGFYAPAVGDYQAMNIMDWTGTQEYRDLMKIEEPYQYRDRLTLPKFIINSTGDQFFLPDSWKFYYHDLQGAKYLRYVPNTDHSLKNSDASETLVAFYDSILRGTSLPQYQWSIEPNGSVQVLTQEQPFEVKLWEAHNPDARDFRLEKIGPAWKSSLLSPKKAGVYSATVEKPDKGWKAFFVELTYKRSDSPVPIKFTTGVQVIPDILPHKFDQPVKPTQAEKGRITQK